MNQGDQKPATKQQEKEKMLDELESLSKMLDEEDQSDLDDDTSNVPEDIPILKSFVDDVPVLSDSMQEEPSEQPTDSLDKNAGSFTTAPVSSKDKLDMSFLDKDPLEISAQVRNRNIPQLDDSQQVSGQKAEQKNVKPETSKTPQATPVEAKPDAKPEAPSSIANEINNSLNRYQTQPGGENPFLPRSTLDKIKENHARESSFSNDDASAQLRKLIQENPLNKVSFEGGTNSKEFRELRQKASHLVNDVIKASLPRLEAELRMKLEQEVDRLFDDAKKN